MERSSTGLAMFAPVWAKIIESMHAYMTQNAIRKNITAGSKIKVSVKKQIPPGFGATVPAVLQEHQLSLCLKVLKDPCCKLGATFCPACD